MSRFTFKLDPLLRARAAEERRHQRAVAEIETERRRLEQAIRDRQAVIESGQSALRDQLTGVLQTDDLRAQAGSTLQAMREAQQLVIELSSVHTRLDAARGTLAEAAKQRRAIEQLRERRLEEWKRDVERRETAALDELAVNRAAREGAP